MSQLVNSKGQILLANLKIARSFFDRAQGLIGTRDLGPEEGLWIHQCNSIHTFFMSFAIDCIFLDADLKVKKLVRDVKPWRLVLPIFGAKSVIEIKSGTLDRFELSREEELHVSA